MTIIGIFWNVLSRNFLLLPVKICYQSWVTSWFLYSIQIMKNGKMKLGRYMIRVKFLENVNYNNWSFCVSFLRFVFSVYTRSTERITIGSDEDLENTQQLVDKSSGSIMWRISTYSCEISFVWICWVLSHHKRIMSNQKSEDVLLVDLQKLSL